MTTTPTNPAEFQKQLAMLTTETMRAGGVPIELMILELEMTKLFLYEHYSMAVKRQQIAAMQQKFDQQARESSSKIVNPNGSPAGDGVKWGETGRPN